MAFMGPATSVAFNTPPAAAKIGFALPFGILLAMLVCLIMASTIGAFSSKLPSAGFAYTFNTHAYGKGTGFTSGWILVLAYGVVGPMLFSAMGGFGNQFLVSQWNLNIPWWVISAVIMAIIWFIGSRGISSSAKTALIFLTLEVGVLLSLFATIIGKGGASGNTIAPVQPRAFADRRQRDRLRHAVGHPDVRRLRVSRHPRRGDPRPQARRPAGPDVRRRADRNRLRAIRLRRRHRVRRAPRCARWPPAPAR